MHGWVTVCAWCQRKQKGDMWVGRGENEAIGENLTHSMCPECRSEFVSREMKKRGISIRMKKDYFPTT